MPKSFQVLFVLKGKKLKKLSKIKGQTNRAGYQSGWHFKMKVLAIFEE
jgi:hypothetical protein